MKYLRNVLTLFAVLAALCGRSHSQAVATAAGPGSYVSVGAGLADYQADYGHNHLAGGFAYVDVNPEWRVGLEGEARILRWHSAEQVTEATYMGGLRVALWPKPHRWAPYGKFLAGVGHIDLPYGYAQGNFLSYAPGAGLDIALTNRIAIRAVDVEYQHWPQFPYGSLSPYGVSAGLSIRLNGISRFPKGARARR